MTQNETYLHNAFKNTQSMIYEVFDECTIAKQLTATFFVICLNIVMVGIMADNDNLQVAVHGTIQEVSMPGHFSIVRFEPVSDDDEHMELLLTKALSLSDNILFGSDCLLLADHVLMHM